MKKAFVIPTMVSRKEELKVLLKSIADLCPDWYSIVITQGYEERDIQDYYTVIAPFGDRVITKHYSEPQGCFGARKRAYEIAIEQGFDIVCNLDDDMEILPSRDYETMATKAMADPSVGFISGNWGRTAALAAKKQTKKEFIKQPVVHTGGGLLFRVQDIAHLIMELPDNLAYEDSEMTAYVYTKGYTNYRYLGSVIVHRVVTRGGLIDWRKKYNGITLGEQYFEYRKSSKEIYGTENNDLCEPLSRDLTKWAKDMHKLNKKKGA